MKKRIVIIEDNAVIREGFAFIIEQSEAYEVCGQYGSCEPALKQLDKDRPDLVMMDIDLPGINGIEGTIRIKERLPECLVMIITVLESSDKVFRSLCAGAVGYIVKNSDNESILKSIAEAFAGGAPMSLNIAKMVVQSFNQPQNTALSSREKEVLRGIAEGKSYTKIASGLFISKETVRSHIKNIYQKLEVNCKADALKAMTMNRWIS